MTTRVTSSRRWRYAGIVSLAATLLFAQRNAHAEPPVPPPPAPPTPPSAAPEAEKKPSLAASLSGAARSEYEAATLLFDDKDYSGALVKYRNAWEAAKDPRLLWNMAACEKNLRRYAKAIRLLERYLAEGKDTLTPDEVREARDVSAALQAFATKVRVTVDEPGASIFVDAESVATSPTPEPLLVDLGDRRVRVQKAGFVTYEKMLTVSGAGQIDLHVHLEPERHEGKLVVKTGADGLVALDGKVIGKGDWAGTVQSGGHTLRITSDGMRPYQSEILVQDNQTRTVDVVLEPAPKGTPTWLWIAGGVVLASGIAVAAVFVFQPGETLRAEPTPGTIPPGTVALSWR